MAKLNMIGPFDFTIDNVNRQIAANKIGNYALGYIDAKGAFRVLYVGRSDNDLNDRIKDHIGEYDNYKMFKFSYATSVKDAYEKECANWHDFGEDKLLKNKIHPDNPDKKQYKCPVCGK